MEQQKTLWVIFSVALFILVIVGVGVIWFMPNGHRSQTQLASTGGSGAQPKISFDPYEWAKSATNNYPGLEKSSKPQNGSNFTIIYGQSPNQQGQAQTEQKRPTPPSASSAGSKIPTTSPPQKQAAPAPKAPQAPAKKTAPAPQKHGRAQAPRGEESAEARVSRVQSRPQRVAEHWIQVAAYTSDFRAEQAKKHLDEQGISSRIFSHVIGGRTYFRVRLGPYATQQEAEKFLDQVKKINAFKNSYISLVYTTRSAN